MSAEPQPTTRQQTLDGGLREQTDTLVDVSDDPGKTMLLLLECPFCGVSWRDAHGRGEHSPGDVADHIVDAHGRPVESERDSEHHRLGGQR